MSTSQNIKNRRKYRKGGKECLSKEVITEQFQDYCSSSSIHGVQYVGDFTRPLIERSWWIIIFAVSSLMTGYLIYNLWVKWRDSPVIVSFKETTTPVWEVPFPAVTICLQVNSRKHQFHMTTSMALETLTPEEEKKLAAMSLLCDDVISFPNASKHLDQSDLDFLIDVAPSLEETFVGCIIRHEERFCFDEFSPVFTEDGLCFTFNPLNHSEIFRDDWSVHPYPNNLEEATFWSLDKGYSEDAPIETYPMRGFDSGQNAGVQFVITGNLSNLDRVCRGPIPGYKILLHNPAEIPISSEKYIRLPTEQEMLILVTPNIITTSPNLRSYDPTVRQCFFPDERQLHYFNVYTERNCELECLANYTLRRCGCIAVYMPRNNNTPVCGGGMKQCVLDMAYEIRIEELKKSKAGIKEDYCNCLPSCTSISYVAETSQTQLQWRTAMDAYSTAMKDMEHLSEYTNSSDITLSSIVIFFTDTQFTTTHRSELYGIVDFLANCGGVLGLFSGISFLSFLEILYFLTLRYWGNVKNNSNRERSVNNASNVEENENMLTS